MGLTEDEIRSIEAALGSALPEEIRARYRVANGLRGPTSCRLLYAFGVDPHDDIVRANGLKKEEWFPPSLAGLLIVGDDGTGNLLCFDAKTGEAVVWNPEDGDWVQDRFPTFSALWEQVERDYADDEDGRPRAELDPK